MTTTTSTSYRGVRYRESQTRKHGSKPDRYFFIRYKSDGKPKEEGAGWASEGMTSQKASQLRARITENIRLGRCPQSLAEMREMTREAREQAAVEERRAAHAATTLDEFWERHYLPSSTLHKTPQTMRTESGYYAKWIKPVLGNSPLSALTPPLIEQVASNAMTAGRSAATIRHLLAIISQVWGMARNHEIVSGECPCTRIKKPRKDNRRMRFLTESEASTLLAELKKRSQDTHDSALLSLFCGLRAGEIHALTWTDLNFTAGTIYIRDPKNKHSRHAYMTDEVRAMLTERSQGPNGTEYVFPAQNGAKRNWVSDTFERVVEQLGLNEGISDTRQRVVFHTLRHTFASWLVQGGTPLYTVAELMGHTTLEMTKRYSHLSPDTVRAAAMSLQGRLSK